MKTHRLFAMIVLPVSAGLVYGQGPAKTDPDGRQGVRNEPLRRELLAMVREDQAARESVLKALGAAGLSPGGDRPDSDPRAATATRDEARRLKDVDDRNRARLREVVGQYGWPGKSLVGADGAHAAWLLVQHSDSDRAFQKKSLGLMESAPRGEVDGADVAYLTDRVLVGEKRPQRYGTQLDTDFKPFPIGDETAVDERRAALGLTPLAEYLKDTRAFYEKYQGEARQGLIGPTRRP